MGVDSTLTVVGSKRTSFVEAVAIDAVAMSSVRPCEYAKRARIGTLVRHAQSGFSTISSMYWRQAQLRNYSAIITPSLLLERFPRDALLTLSSCYHLSCCRRSTLAPSLRTFCAPQARTRSSFTLLVMSFSPAPTRRRRQFAAVIPSHPFTRTRTYKKHKLLIRHGPLELRSNYGAFA